MSYEDTVSNNTYGMCLQCDTACKISVWLVCIRFYMVKDH